MKKRGFLYQVGASIGNARPLPNPYSVVTWEEEKAGAYHTPPVAQVLDPNSSYLKGLAPVGQRAWSVALLGLGQARTTVSLPSGATYSYVPDACSSTAVEEVFGLGFEGDYLAVQDLAGVVGSRTLADPRVRAAIGAWATCVAASGAGPVSTLDDLRTIALDAASSASTRSAMFQIDLSCEVASNVRGVLNEVQPPIERLVAEQMPEPLAKLAARVTIDGDASRG